MVIRVNWKNINKKELKRGIPVEMEHTSNKRTARHIAAQHLMEFPQYYSKGLIPMEKRLAKLKRKL